MEGQQEAFGKTTPKEGNYEKQGKNQSSEELEQHGALVPKELGEGGGNQWYPRTLE